MAVRRQDIAHGVVGVVVRGAARCLGQLPQGIIGVRHRAVCVGVGGDVAHVVIGIGESLVRGQVVDHAGHLAGGAAGIDVPVGVALGIDAARRCILPN